MPIDTLTTRADRLLSLYEVDSITRNELLERVSKLKVEKQEAEKKLEQVTAIKKETLDVGSLEVEVKEFCRKLKDSLDNCSFINKRFALDVLQVQVVATPAQIDIKMVVPLELITIEQKREYEIPKHQREKRTTTARV